MFTLITNLKQLRTLQYYIYLPTSLPPSLLIQELILMTTKDTFNIQEQEKLSETLQEIMPS